MKLVLLILLSLFVGAFSGCQCDKDDCGCCQHIEIDVLGVNDTGCLNISYIPATIALSLTFSLDNDVLINETVSAMDPDVCLPIPVIKDFVDICFDFTNMKYTSTDISGCVAVAFTLFGVTVGSFGLGCFDLPI